MLGVGGLGGRDITSPPGREGTEYICIQSDTNKTFGHFHSSAEWKSCFRRLRVHTAVLEVMRAFFSFFKKHIKYKEKN